MPKLSFTIRHIALVLSVFCLLPLQAQERKGAITGQVTDASHGVLRGARVELEPKAQPAATDDSGNFTISNLDPGTYTVTISFVGMATYTSQAKVTAGSSTQLNAELKLASATDSVIVTAERVFGEADAINVERSADNIVQVLPAEIITSLPNANVADAVGRLPSVTLERDEGEGKYVQIRGTEPRLSNVTIDGVNVPSAETGVRQIKLDVLASDLVSDVEINKTLQANMDGDGIGGSVNLKTKTAGDTPTVDLFGIGGYTPIIGGRGVDQFGATVGKRFGASKRFGVLFGATYDYNGRGINDIEPVPTAGSAAEHYDSMDLRDYVYYRTREGFAGSTDYKLGDASDIYARVFYSTFQDYGNKWVYTLKDGNADPAMSQDWRRPNYATGSFLVGGHHSFASSWFQWDLSVARSRQLSGSGGADYSWNGGTVNCADDPVATTDRYVPQFTPSCFTPGASNTIDRANYALTDWSPPTFGRTAQLNLQASASYARNYHLGSRFGTFEFGAKIRNSHKYDNTFDEIYCTDLAGGAANPACDNTAADLNLFPGSQFADGFTDPKYYMQKEPFGNTTNYTQVQSFVLSNPGSFTCLFNDYPTPIPCSNSHTADQNNYTLNERISAGYLMNTIDLTSRLRLVAGVRFEATSVSTLSFDESVTPAPANLTAGGGGSYFNVLPSAALRVGLTTDSDIRFVYGRGLSRPDPQDIAQAVGQPDFTQNPPTVSIGNPALKAETANNYDILYEHYLKPLGLFSAGYFFKELYNPIVSTLTTPTAGQFAGFLVTQPINAGGGHVGGIELAYQQQLTFLPGALRGLGIIANYSYTYSEASGLPGRSDHPALLRQAPNTWNISPSYDYGRLSARLGLSYNGANIFAYQWQDGADATGIHGPSGDNYLYPHLQVDAQATIRLEKGFSAIVYGLNLTNEVFGFYNGSPQYVVQREFYQPTFAGGLKWTTAANK
jgi:TonB-dependent receptor